jgi:hypothetical protein
VQSCLTAETDLLLLLIEYKLLNDIIKGKKILVLFVAVSRLYSLGDDRWQSFSFNFIELRSLVPLAILMHLQAIS